MVVITTTAKRGSTQTEHEYFEKLENMFSVFSTYKVNGKNGITVIVGKDKEFKALAVAFGDIPEKTPENIKRLSLDGWTQREIGAMYNIHQSTVGEILDNIKTQKVAVNRFNFVHP